MNYPYLAAFSCSHGKILMYNIQVPECPCYTLSTKIAIYESRTVFA